MSVIDTLFRHRIIINRLRRKPASFQEICNTLQRESELQERKLDISIRTFQRDMEDISSVYGIDIIFDKKYKVYRIEHGHLNENDERILEAFDLLNLLNQTERLKDIVYFEKRKPSGTENLYPIKQAITQKKMVQFYYDKYWDESTFRTVEPYALKECQNRWYLLARNPDEVTIKTFALDRISELNALQITFNYPEDYNVEQTFKHCFGIIGPSSVGMNVEEVILSFSEFQGKYVKSLPLHESQEILIDTKEELQIRLRLYLTYDLIKELLAYGSNVTVLSPQVLIDELKKLYMDAVNKYQ